MRAPRSSATRCAPTPLASTWAAARLLAAAGEAGGWPRARGTVAQWDEGADARPGRADARCGDGSLSGVKIAVPDAGGADVLVVTADGGRHFAVEAGATSTIEPRSSARHHAAAVHGAPRRHAGRGARRRRDCGARLARDRGDDRRRVGRRRASARWRWRSPTPRSASSSSRPIGSYQAVSHACAQMLLEIEGARAAVLLGGLGARPRARRRRGWPPTSRRPTRPTRPRASPLGAPGPRRHRLHLGARPALLPQARRGQRARVRRRALAPRAASPALCLASSASRSAADARARACSASSTVRPAPPSGSVIGAGRLGRDGGAVATPLVSSAPTRPSSDGPAMSERIAFGAAQETHGSRTNVSSEVTLSLIAPRIFCWRRARVRSFSRGLHSFLRVRASASACLPLSSCVAAPCRRSV